MKLFFNRNRFLSNGALVAIFLATSCSSDSEKSEGTGSVPAILNEAQLTKPSTDTLTSITRASLISEMSNYVRDEFSNHPKTPTSTGSTSTGATSLPEGCLKEKSSVTNDRFQISLSLDFKTCSPSFPLDLKSNLYADIGCPGRAKDIESEYKKAKSGADANIASNFEIDCSGDSSTRYLEFSSSGNFIATFETVGVMRASQAAGCAYKLNNKVKTLQGTCEYIEVKKTLKNDLQPENNGKYQYRRAVAKDVVESAGGWPTAGTIEFELNGEKATITFKADGSDPSYVVNSGEQATGTISKQ